MPLNDEILNKLAALVAQQSVKNSSKYSHTEENIRDFIQDCFALIPERNQQEYAAILLSTEPNPKTEKLAFDINRSLAAFDSNQLEDAKENFRSLNLSNSSEAKSLFDSDNFTQTLQRSHQVFNLGKYDYEKLSTQTRTSLSTFLTKIAPEEAQQLFDVTANVLIGINTKKNTLHQRSEDQEFTRDEEGRLKIKAVLVSAIAQYIEQNFDKLKEADSKTIRRLGTSLKQDYKDAMSSSKNVSYNLNNQEILKQFNKSALSNAIIAGIDLSNHGVSSSPATTVSSSPTNSRSNSPASNRSNSPNSGKY